MAVLAYATNLLGTLEGNTVNARFAIRGKERPPTNIVIVTIDDKSFQDLRDYPFPRRYYARLIRRIAPLHPLAIGFDIQLSEESIYGQDRDDAPLALTIQQASHGLTVFSFTETDAQGHVRLGGKVPPSFFRHKIVVIGATAPTLQDIQATSTESLMAGPEIQANAIDTALRGFPLRYASGVVDILLILPREAGAAGKRG